MKEKIQIIWMNTRLYILDVGGAGIFGLTLTEWLDLSVHMFFTIIGPLIGGSLLFIAQKTILPIIANRINKKFEKWFNTGTKIEDKD